MFRSDLSMRMVLSQDKHEVSSRESHSRCLIYHHSITMARNIARYAPIAVRFSLITFDSSPPIRSVHCVEAKILQILPASATPRSTSCSHSCSPQPSQIVVTWRNSTRSRVKPRMNHTCCECANCAVSVNFARHLDEQTN